MQAPRTTLLALGVLLTGASAVSAHDFWAEPAAYVVRVGEETVVRLRVGDHFAGDELPRMARHCLRFDLLAPDGARKLEGESGEQPAGRFTPTAPGLHWIVYRSAESLAEVEPQTFGPYLEAEGNGHWTDDWKAFDPRQAAPVKEAFSRCVKALVRVLPAPGAKAAGTVEAGFDAVAGLTLEIVPEANPLALQPGESLPVRLLWKGKPLADQQVSALSAERPDDPVLARTDAEGRARLLLARRGLYLLKSVHFARTREGEEARYRSTWAALTFELPR